MKGYIALGNNIRKFRQKKRLTQLDLANLCGWSAMSISRYEKANRRPGLEELALIAKKLNVTLDQLIEGEPRLVKKSS